MTRSVYTLWQQANSSDTLYNKESYHNLNRLICFSGWHKYMTFIHLFLFLLNIIYRILFNTVF